MSFPWNYDPQGLLNSIRVKNKLPPFIQESKPDIENFSNQIEWVENRLVDPTTNTEIVKKGENSQAMIVTKQSEVSNKRSRDDEGYLAQTITENKFKLIYNKSQNYYC